MSLESRVTPIFHDLGYILFLDTEMDSDRVEDLHLPEASEDSGHVTSLSGVLKYASLANRVRSGNDALQIRRVEL